MRFAFLFVSLALAAGQLAEHPDFGGLRTEPGKELKDYDGRIYPPSHSGFAAVSKQFGDNAGFSILFPDPTGLFSPVSCSASKIWDAGDSAQPPKKSAGPAGMADLAAAKGRGKFKCALATARHCILDYAKKRKFRLAAAPVADTFTANGAATTSGETVTFRVRARARQFSDRFDSEPEHGFVAVVPADGLADAIQSRGHEAAFDNAILFGDEAACGGGLRKAKTIKLCPAGKIARPGKLLLDSLRMRFSLVVAPEKGRGEHKAGSNVFRGEVVQPSPADNPHKKLNPALTVGAGVSDSGSAVRWIGDDGEECLAGIHSGVMGEQVVAPAKLVGFSTNREFMHRALAKVDEIPSPASDEGGDLSVARSRPEKAASRLDH